MYEYINRGYINLLTFFFHGKIANQHRPKIGTSLRQHQDANRWHLIKQQHWNMKTKTQDNT